VIDFIQPGRLWHVCPNTTGITLTAEADLALDASWDGATFSQIVDNVLTSISAQQETRPIWQYRYIVGGVAPYYKLRIDPAGNENGEEIIVRVTYMVADQDRKQRVFERLDQQSRSRRALRF
jgi:hypothetical protein